MVDGKKPSEEEMGLKEEDTMSDEKRANIARKVEEQRAKDKVVETTNYVFAKDVPSAEPPVEYQQPGKKMESFDSGILGYGAGILIRDKTGQIAEITSFYMVKETRWVEKRVAGIKGPEKKVRPRVLVRYHDGTEKDLDMEEAEGPLYLSSQQAKLTDEEKLQHPTSFEARGHRYQLGDLVSYGYRVGKLVAIFPEKDKVGLTGREGKFGQTESATEYYWLVDMNEVDYLDREENGAIKKNTDGTLYKPSLNKKEEIAEI